MKNVQAKNSLHTLASTAERLRSEDARSTPRRRALGITRHDHRATRTGGSVPVTSERANEERPQKRPRRPPAACGAALGSPPPPLLASAAAAAAASCAEHAACSRFASAPAKMPTGRPTKNASQQKASARPRRLRAGLVQSACQQTSSAPGARATRKDLRQPCGKSGTEATAEAAAGVEKRAMKADGWGGRSLGAFRSLLPS